MIFQLIILSNIDKMNTKFLKDNFIHYEKDDFYKRRNNVLVTKKTMKYEFGFMIQKILNKQIADIPKDDWECHWDLTRRYNEGDDQKEYCVCTHDIYNLCFIIYKPYSLCLQVGIDCVKKINNKELYKSLQEFFREKLKKKKEKKLKEKISQPLITEFFHPKKN